MALACDLPENFPSTEMEQNGMRVLRFDRLITVISKNEGKTGQASYECSMPSFNDHEILKSDLANKGTKITPQQILNENDIDYLKGIINNEMLHTLGFKDIYNKSLQNRTIMFFDCEKSPQYIHPTFLFYLFMSSQGP